MPFWTDDPHLRRINRTLKARRLELSLSQAKLDKCAGLRAGYVASIEAWRGKRGRGLGLLTLPRLLQTLGVALVLVPVDEK